MKHILDNLFYLYQFPLYKMLVFLVCSITLKRKKGYYKIYENKTIAMTIILKYRIYPY